MAHYPIGIDTRSHGLFSLIEHSITYNTCMGTNKHGRMPWDGVREYEDSEWGTCGMRTTRMDNRDKEI